MWMALASAGLSALGAYTQGAVTKAQVKGNNAVSAAVTEANNRVRTAGNAFSAARGSLSRYVQSVNNNNALEAGGEALEANLINARRQDDAMAEASFENQIRAAEQLGSQVAAAAFSGVGGEVADTISISTRLMQQRAARNALQSREFAQYDSVRRAGAIAQQTVRSLDQSLILDSLDYSIDVAQYQKAPSVWGGVANAVADSLMKTGLNTDSGKKPAKSEWGTGSEHGNQDYGMFI